MTGKRRIILTVVSVSIGMLLSLLIFYVKKGSFDQHTWLTYFTVFAYSLMIVVAIGWYLQIRKNKNSKLK